MFNEPAPARGALRVKICGICHADDAIAAAEAGADAIGLNTFRGSKRFVALARATSWLIDVPASVRKIAIMVNPTRDEALRVASLPSIDGLQLHGNESPEFCQALAQEGVAFAKALRVSDETSLDGLTSYFTRYLVLDSAAAGLFGGSGKTFPWQIAREFVEAHSDLNVLLAGGLTPDNVAAAVRAVRPFGVDVTSGVEASPGRKDHARLRAFISAARAAI